VSIHCNQTIRRNVITCDGVIRQTKQIEGEETMKRIIKPSILAVGLAALLVGAANSRAQGPGNFDPAQFQQMMMDRIKERLEVANDDEWRVIQERVERIMQARFAVGFGGMSFGGFGRRGGRNGEPGDSGQRGSRGGFASLFNAQPNLEVEDLQKALDAKASTDDLKAKLAKLREANKVKQTRLEKAQEELRQVLTVRQEAAAVLMGLLQ
jgi:hypothetical protein